jgi:hypothetical protein
VIELGEGENTNNFPALHVDFILTVTSASLAVLASFFLLDALRRMNKSFKENHKISSDKFAMFLLHILAVFISQIGLVVLVIFLQIEVNEGGKHAANVSDTLKLILSFSLCLAQCLFVYLLIRFQKPIELTDRKSNLSESETSKSLNRNQSVESSSKEDLLASYSSVHSAATGREQGMVALLMRTKTETMESRSSSMSIN